MQRSVSACDAVIADRMPTTVVINNVCSQLGIMPLQIRNQRRFQSRRITKLQTARTCVYSKSTGLQEAVLQADKLFSVTAQRHKLPVAENVCLPR